MLALATVGFAVNFWAWALLSPLGPRFKDGLDLSSFEQSLLVAVPVVVGSLGRIPVGALTDRSTPFLITAAALAVYAVTAALLLRCATTSSRNRTASFRQPPPTSARRSGKRSRPYA